MRVGSLVDVKNESGSFMATLLVTDDSRWASEGSFKAVTVVVKVSSLAWSSVGDYEEYSTADTSFQFTELSSELCLKVGFRRA